MKRKTYSIAAILLGSGSWVICAPSANAADAPQVETSPSSESAEAATDGAPEIVVTATKRSESLQRVPISIAAVTSAELAQSGISDTTALAAKVPGLVFSTVIGSGQPYLRGVGNDSLSLGADSSVSVYVDGIYQARTGGAIQELFDVDRVEVIKGPQGTLYGRNSVGGTISIISTAPKEWFEVLGDITIGNNQMGKARVTVNVPISSNLFFRASGITSHQDGFFRNLASPDRTRYGKTDLNAGRFALRWLASDTIDVTLSADVSDDRSVKGMAWATLSAFPSPGIDFCRGAPFPCPTDSGQTPGQVNDNPYQNYLNILPIERTRQRGVSLTTSVDLGMAELKLLSAYRYYNHNDRADTDATDYPDGQQADFLKSETLTQDIQMISTGNTPFQWVAGLSYLHDDGNQMILADLAAGNQNLAFRSELKTSAIAAYAEASYKLDNGLKFTLGGRYSHERKKVSVDHDLLLFGSTLLPLAIGRSSRSWEGFTPKFGVDFQVNPDLLLYASVQKGFKSGGFNTVSTDISTSDFKPEKMWAYEAGFKSQLLGNTVRLNAAAFYYDYKDIQVSRFDSSAVIYTNADSASIKGLEANITVYPTDWLNFDLRGQYLDATFGVFDAIDSEDIPAGLQDLTGNRLVRSPKFSGGASVNVTTQSPWGNEIKWFAEYSWTGRVYYTYFNKPGIDQGPVGLLSARASTDLVPEHLTLSVWGKNLTNKTWFQTVLQNTAFVGSIGSPAQPRTYGITLTGKY